MRYLPILLLLAGCAHNPPPPEVVEIPVTTYIPIPPHLTAPCAVALPEPATNGELLLQWREYQEAMRQCERQLEAIRELL